MSRMKEKAMTWHAVEFQLEPVGTDTIITCDADARLSSVVWDVTAQRPVISMRQDQLPLRTVAHKVALRPLGGRSHGFKAVMTDSDGKQWAVYITPASE